MLTLQNRGNHRQVDGYDWVIYLSEEWEGFFGRHLIHELARQLPHSRILCVARPMCLLTGPLRRRGEFLAWMQRPGLITGLDKNLLYFRPGVLLHDHLAAHVPLARRINRLWLARQLSTAVERAGLRQEHLIAVIFDPFQLEYLGLAEESFSVYDCYDEYSVQARVPLLRTRRQVLERERAILDQVDLVFVVSETLQRRIAKGHPRVHLVPNAVDSEHFGQATNPTLKPTPELAGISHPVIGYLGNITSRIDFNLPKHLAVSHPEWSVVLVGGASEPGVSIPVSLARLPNVYCLGTWPYEGLPGCLRVFDVCIIPYAPNDPFNINCSPLKLYEYLATGKPIVSTDLPAVRPFDSLVYIAQNADEFEQQVVKALREQDKVLSQLRLAVARENSWDQRAESVVRALASLIAERTGVAV